MGQVDGFLLYTRELPEKEAIESRKKHYKEFVELPSEEQLNKQSSRCMSCGVPFCMSGCPLGNIIPEFNDAVYKKEWEKAFKILKSTNNFPEFTGRICPAPCEGSCVLGINEKPVTIEEIEKNIVEIAYKKGYAQPTTPKIATKKNVAIIGSGPAGLAAADQLNQLGHTVTVFERDSHIGGLLRFGIPDFKLEKNIIDRRIAVMKKEGIVFKPNTNVGVDISTQQLIREYDAVVLATGSTTPRDLPIPNREAKGVYFAMQFLKQSNQKVNGISYQSEEINVKDKKVLVIGGGDTGSDCIGTSNRQGAKTIHQIEIMPIPPIERDETMPWPNFPMVLKTTTSHEEGCNRQWSVNAKEFIKDQNGNVKGVRLVKVEWKKDPDTKRYISFTEIPNSEFILECDFVFLAMGFLHVQHQGLTEKLDLKLDAKGNILASDLEYKTNHQNIFSCGDARRGQSLVVWAIQEGRSCAKKVNEFLVKKN